MSVRTEKATFATLLLCVNTHISKADVTFYMLYTGLNGAIDHAGRLSLFGFHLFVLDPERFHVSVCNVRHRNVRHPTAPEGIFFICLLLHYLSMESNENLQNTRKIAKEYNEKVIFVISCL